MDLLDSKAWRAMNNGWIPPIKKDKEGNSVLKPEEDWDKEEALLALGNSKALNALFNGIDRNIFRLVHHCELAKDVWDTLKTTHEGTSKVKMSRLQLLTTKFENLRMKEEENIHEFHMNILEISNASGELGEKMSEEKLVRKILRSLPKRFAMKVVAIEEAHDISNMKVEELIGSLQTFEMGINDNDNGDKKNKSIALVSNKEEETQESDTDSENLAEAIALLGKQFNRIIKRMGHRPKSIEKNSESSKSGELSKKTKSDDKGKGIQCHGCEGFGHIKAECPSYLKKQKKGLAVTWSDEDYESESEESAKHITALTSVCDSDSDTSEGELTFDKLASSYKELCIRSAEVCQEGLKQKNLIIKLEEEKKGHLETIENLNNEVSDLKSKLDQMSKSIRMLNSGTKTLDEILQSGKNAGNMTGLGYDK